jgi:lipopolysaccharide transport system ATP-binding protein
MLIKTLAGISLGGGTTAQAYRWIPQVTAGSICTVEFVFTANLAAGLYFLNAGVSGVVDGIEGFLDRKVEVAAFKILPDQATLMTGMVDFYVEPRVQWQSFGKVHE